MIRFRVSVNDVFSVPQDAWLVIPSALGIDDLSTKLKTACRGVTPRLGVGDYRLEVGYKDGLPRSCVNQFGELYVTAWIG